ncbi:MAG: hypothetical protein PUF97_00740 [Bifidobacteriaceae bacterium]|nr:hypothetical protein [Bifidobacteriaceae bacterium]
MNHGVDADPIPDEGARLTHADDNGEEGDEGFTKGLSASEPIWGSDDADDPAVDWDSARQALKSCGTDDSMTVETGRWPRFFRHPSSIAVMVLCVLLGLTFVAMWFVPRAARRGLYGLWAALLPALAMTLLFRALGIRRRHVTGTPARALTFFAGFLLAAAAFLCLAYVPNAVRLLLDVPYLDAPAQTTLQPSLGGTERSANFAESLTASLDQMFGDDTWTQYEIFQHDRKTLRSWNVFELTEEQYRRCDAGLRERNDSSSDGAQYALIAYLPNSRYVIDIVCTVDDPPVTFDTVAHGPPQGVVGQTGRKDSLLCVDDRSSRHGGGTHAAIAAGGARP